MNSYILAAAILGCPGIQVEEDSKANQDTIRLIESRCEEVTGSKCLIKLEYKNNHYSATCGSTKETKKDDEETKPSPICANCHTTKPSHGDGQGRDIDRQPKTDIEYIWSGGFGDNLYRK